jgi:hypothetical protein
MNPLKIITLLMALMLIPMFALAAGKHALLIGIQYENTPFFLKGPANDVKLTKRMLQKSFGFQKEDFMILLNEQATHTGIENAFHELIKKVKSGDFVYIYYSGHGSQTADLNGDEADNDGMDETWVSYRSRSSTDKHKDNYDVLDDEIGAWLAQLYAKTDKVVFVSDSCHSATVSRASQAVVRAVKKDKRPHLLGKGTYAKPTTDLGIRVSAARDDQTAEDGFKKDKKTYDYGLFTWHWVSNLEKAKAGYSWHDVFKRTYAQVTTIKGIEKQPDMSQPQLEGEQRSVLLGDDFDFTERPPTIPVYSLSEDEDWFKILAGSLVGVTEGSVYRKYDPESIEPDNLPRLTITTVTPFASFGEPKTEDTFKTGDLVVEESHAYHFHPIKIDLNADFPKKDKALLEAIESGFQSTPDDKKSSFFPYQLTQDSSEADLRLHILRPKRENGQFVYEKDDTLPKSFPDQSPELWVLTREGRLLNQKLQIAFATQNPDEQKEQIQLLKDNLKKWARWQEIKKLKNPKSAVPVKVQTEIWRNNQSCDVEKRFGTYCQIGQYRLSALDKHTPNLGDVLRFTLDNQSDKRYYCYLLYITSEGGIHLIYPSRFERAEFTRVKKGEKRQTGISVVLKENGERTFKLITTERSIEPLLFEQSGYKLRAGSNPLERLLFNAVHGQRGTRSTSNNEWATEQVTIDVK